MWHGDFAFRIESLEVMCSLGLFINDLSLHDSSRDLVLAGTQQSAELKLALDQVSVRCVSAQGYNSGESHYPSQNVSCVFYKRVYWWGLF